MNSYPYNFNLTGPSAVYFLLAASWFFAVISAARIKVDNHEATYFGIRIKRRTSIILFLNNYRRKVPMWAVIMQVLNYALLISAVFTFELLGINHFETTRIFILILTIYMSVLSTLMLTDFIIYLIKNDGFF